MRLDAAPGSGGTIQGFRGRGFRIAGVDHPGGVIVSAAGARDWPALSLSSDALGDLPPGELLLIGTGPALIAPDPALLAGLPMPAEAMDSRAAARTYNLLLGEGRAVVAALLPL